MDGPTAVPLTGRVFRESSLVSGVVQEGEGLLTAAAFQVTTVGSMPTTKAWPLKARTQVSQVKTRSFLVLQNEQRVSTALALLCSGYTEQRLSYFTVRTAGGLLTGSTRFRVALEQADEAARWCKAFQAVIDMLKASKAAQPDDSTASYSRQASLQSSLSDGLLTTEDSVGSDGLPAAPEAEPVSAEVEEPKHAEVVEESAAQPREWLSYDCQNGMTAHVGVSGVNEGAFMLEAVIHATPAACVAAQAPLKQTSGLFTWKLLHRIDKQTQILQSTFRPVGMFALLVAPREFVVRRAWRCDEDGCYTVLMTDAAHSDAPGGPERKGWYTPVRGHVSSVGFTFAPLEAAFRRQGGSSSDETLATVIAKVDWGGWLGSATRRVPMLNPLTRWFINQMVHAAAAFRHRVEQGRFVRKSLALTSGVDDAVERVPAAAASLQPVPAHAAKGHVASGLAAPLAEAMPLLPASRKLQKQDSMFITPRDLFRTVDKPDVVPKAATHGMLPEQFWSDPRSAGFKVRGSDYLQSKRKVPADDPVFELVAVDLLELAQPTFHIAQHLLSMRAHKGSAFHFILQLMVPGVKPLSLTITWAAECNPGVTQLSPQGEEDMMSPFDLSLARFLAGGSTSSASSRRHKTFKLIPRITEGSWIIKQSVGTTPVLLGNKLRTEYHRGANYIEIDVDIASSSVANMVVGMVSAATKSLVVDMGIVLEGHTADELPESLLGTVRLSHLDLGFAAYLSVPAGEVTASPTAAATKGAGSDDKGPKSD